MAGVPWNNVRPESAVPDRDLLRRYAAARDEAAFELLVWRYSGLVLGVGRRILRDAHAAEDAAQAVFLILAKKAHTVRGDRLGDWLHAVARRVAVRAAKGKRTVRLAAEPAVVPEPADDWQAVLDAELAKLPDRFRLPVIYCYLQGLSTEQAAAKLGVPRGTILSRLAAARTKLAARLTRRGVTLPAAGLAALGLCPEAGTAAVSRFLLGSFPDSIPNPIAQWAEVTMRAMDLRRTVTWACGLLASAGLCTAVGVSGGQGPGKNADGSTPAADRAEPKSDRAVQIEKALHILKKRTDELEDEVRAVNESFQRLSVAGPDAAAKLRAELAELKLKKREKDIDIAVLSRFLGAVDKPTEREIADAAATAYVVVTAHRDFANQRTALDAETAAGFAPEKLAARRTAVAAAEKEYDAARLKCREVKRLELIKAATEMAGDVQRRLAQARLEASDAARRCEAVESTLRGYESYVFNEARLKVLRDDLEDLYAMRRKLQREKLELDLGR